MTSRAFEAGVFLDPDNASEKSTTGERVQGYRKHNVYDAVAGKISLAGYIPKNSVVASTRDTTSSSNIAARPETVLYQSRYAPARYAEFDVYFANERRSVTGLPESDLLKSLHCYVSDFYARACVDNGVNDWKSMDETALLALGILLEELSLESLGKTGDLVFTEGGETVSKPPPDRRSRSKSRERLSKKRKLNAVDDS